MIDSKIFGHQWTTTEAREIFSEKARVARWLDVVISLAKAQAQCGIIPIESATEIARLADADISIDDIATRTRETSHSTLGMIHVLRDLLPASSAEHVYYGTTVQDISDSSLALEMRAVGSLIWRDLWLLERDLLQLTKTHRDTPMVGRTHGQPGSPITFGLKVASWADEIGRHLQRLQEGRERLLFAQFGGAVGTLAFFGDQALDLRSAFCRELDLEEPDIAWISARDRLAEFANFCAMAISSLARISDEVFNLQRQEIGELAERTQSSTVGSITMPHKRNPESSEQVVGLARLVRSQANVLTETMVQVHERDARGWKVEWAAFPEMCHYSLAALAMTRELIAGLEVNSAAMKRNLGLSSSSEHLLSYMSARLGKHQAQDILQDAYRKAREEGHPVSEMLEGIATEAELGQLSKVDVGASGLMIDRVIKTACDRRSSETESWA